ncbi:MULTISPECIES: non-hydrolyzing UDP-N-acetylglucosamine 2-epimerase [Serratia]|uniref:non-hydrolyzing UDP-N-acetylglucosamine 2-epimerase n=1 Tax=Serratia TaxID=613 RepID=UPI000CCBFCF6|nr:MULTISPECIES: UDP-N-acetylglucosamine 2-epimerase (non-hydrolyzing) [Serratia]MBH2599901.1 UDP-N-acetylglucosamine 2-epimerase (non-hydrolyzing) [Serratia ureilytica]MBH3119316.1 UDP-N-acetylglucosamine 2-epimerase (non-hydrolyzing) [Serratia ureilytica]MBN5357579.1 UDP-N-acetylglucosamine 2-epimerase (non-hydrolyzing) [Serratia ureilytica]PNU40698.1 UDP-N-acetylglucosamine 2-epimerase (non-hydrolyzing) [Serratia marcescens]BEM47424.1 UDP-N-acetyl glucosamine 2-epimerase [Serratia marcescen
MLKKIMCVVGTRPEAIKMAPVIKALHASGEFDVCVLATAQHRDLLDQAFQLFEIEADYDLNVMTPGQTLPELTARLMTSIDRTLEEAAPDLVIAQGDTTTVFVTSLACFYKKVPFAHLEAGLRTHDLYSPFPEEANRILAGHLARLHFAPTEVSKSNLLREGIPAEHIHVTGNTVIDALLTTAQKTFDFGVDIPQDARMLLITSHRRENFGQPIVNICNAALELIEKYSDIYILFPVHPNPNVREVTDRLLKEHERIKLVSPFDYGPFVAAMKNAYLILSDSGGVQEEAPALGKPVLVLRRDTERPEAVSEGVVKLIGTEQADIVREASLLLDSPQAYQKMAKGSSPYGDGESSQRIVRIVRNFFTEQCQ